VAAGPATLRQSASRRSALRRTWPQQDVYRLTKFVTTKQVLAAALHSGDPAINDLPAPCMGRFVPALKELLSTATASGDVRVPITAQELIGAVAQLCHTPVGIQSINQSRRMVAILVTGLRFDAARSSD
jgi:hypothetical protein